MCKCNRTRAAIACLGLLLIQSQAQALITALTPLQAILKQSTFIVVAKVESVDAGKPAMVLVVEENLKGKPPLRRLAVVFKGDAEAEKRDHVPQILKRVAPKMPLLLFILQQDKKFAALAYTNGTWFRIIGIETDGEVHWSLTHGEPYLRKTFKGSTAELKRTIVECLSGKKDPPKPDAKEKPGFGPEAPVQDKSENRGRAAGNALFAVIPTVLLGGPLAILAMLLPVVFGGLMLVLRRWLAALSVLSTNSALYVLHGICQRWLANSWWGTPSALWLTMAVITLFGILWAWRRNIHLIASQISFLSLDTDREPERKTPRGVELIALSFLSVLCLVLAVILLPRSLDQFELWGKILLVFSAGLWTAMFHSLYRRWRGELKPGLPGEGVLLWTMLLVSCVLFPTFRVETHEDRSGESIIAAGEWLVRVAWRFQPPVENCWIASSPQVDKERVYIGVAFPSAFGSSGGIYCVDRKTGKQIWMFNDGGAMKEVFSSPCVADGSIYVGEGFHQHTDCKLYCLDAATGKKRWDFATASHTESTPCCSDGKVYFGAGDDGLYCLDTATGRKIWHLPGLHVDANPLVIDNRLYGGSGAGDSYKETMLFCLSADSGEVIWRKPVDLPVWGMPAVQSEYLYAGIGNGNFLVSADQMEKPEKPAGAVLCLERATGKRIWRYDVPDGVLGRLGADDQHIWFGARDRYCYCLDRRNGVLIWKTDLGSPIVASPSLLDCGKSKILYVAGSSGLVCRLDPGMGKTVWTFDVARDAKQPATVFSSPLVQLREDRGGKSRWIWFGCGLSDFRRGILYCLEEYAINSSDN